MCLAVAAWMPGQRFCWLLASNRDEFFDRPAAPLSWWQPKPGAPMLLSGRDLSAGGTWLGLDRRGRLALVTNVREPGRFEDGLPSRGELVLQWLAGEDDESVDDRLDALRRVPRNGFNLLAADLQHDHLAWTSNRAGAPLTLAAGLHGLSNAALDTPWPKVVRLKQRLAAALAAAGTDAAAGDRLSEAAFAALADAEPASDAELPSTGVPLERERQLSPAFIRIAGGEGPVYGTRCSTLVIAEQGPQGRELRVIERRFDSQGRRDADTTFRFTPQP